MEVIECWAYHDWLQNQGCMIWALQWFEPGQACIIKLIILKRLFIGLIRINANKIMKKG